MPLEIVPFAEEHLEAAAELLAARHAADRAREPELPAQFVDAAATLPLLRTVLAEPLGSGVVALRAGQMAGFLLGGLALASPDVVQGPGGVPRAAGLWYHGHAVAPENARELYRELYAAVAPRWLAAGCFHHAVWLPAADRVAQEAWFSLGFGCEGYRGLRSTDPPTRFTTHDGLELHRAAPEDVDVVARLVTALYRYHAETPAFLLFAPENAAAIRREQQASLADPERPRWLAYRDGQPLGLTEFAPSSTNQPMYVPERCLHLAHGYTEAAARGSGVGSALLEHGLAWARNQGYERCTVGWVETNLIAARFWPARGFRPIAVKLVRHVDERIAWAHGGVT